jgi:transcriptional regulator NrdR family protein
MDCPVCQKKGKSQRLRVTNSRPDGPFRRLRFYECQVCGFSAWNTETLEAAVKVVAVPGRTGINDCARCG